MFDECECTNQWCPFYCTWRDVFYLLCSPCRLDPGAYWGTNSALPPSCCFFFCADCGSRLLLRCIKVYDSQTFILKPRATYCPVPIWAISNCTNLTARPSCHWIQKTESPEWAKGGGQQNVHSGFYLEMRDYISKVLWRGLLLWDCVWSLDHSVLKRAQACRGYADDVTAWQQKPGVSTLIHDCLVCDVTASSLLCSMFRLHGKQYQCLSEMSVNEQKTRSHRVWTVSLYWNTYSCNQKHTCLLKSVL